MRGVTLVGCPIRVADAPKRLRLVPGLAYPKRPVM